MSFSPLRDYFSRISSADNTPYEKVGNKEPISIADEVPFEILESREWVRLSTICEVARGGSPRPIKDYLTESEDGINWIKIGDTDKGGKYIRSTKEKIIPEGVKKSRLVHVGDFLLTNSMSFGRPYILNIDGCIHDGWLVLSGYEKAYNQDFLYYMLSSSFAYSQFCDVVSGAVVKNLNSDKVSASLFPLPPLDEQWRIVTVIEKIEPHIEEYGLAESQLTELQESFPDRLKKSILQMAVQGRLVPQNSNDEPASILLERIRTEKEHLIAEGKIKRDKNESVIFRRDNSHYEKRGKTEVCIDAELPFDIPDSWCWCRLRTICYNMRYGTAKKSSKAGEVAVLRMGNIQHGEIDYSNLVYSNDPEDNVSLLLQNKDILFNRTNSRELVGKTGIYRGDIPAIYAGYLVLIRPIFIDPEYINYMMNSQYEWSYCQNVRSDGINQANVSAAKIGEFLVPIPPLKEQMRIVQMLIKVLPLTSNRKYKFSL